MRSHKKDVGLFASSIIVCLLIFFFVLYPWFQFDLPLVYQEDGLFGSAAIKTIIETGWYLTNPNLGAPGVYQLGDYPQSDAASFLLIRLIALFSKNYAVVLNVFYLGTYLLSIIFSLIVLRILKIKRISAFAISLLFTFLPYHWLRGEHHLLLSAIYVVPLYVLLMVSVYRPTLHPIFNKSGLMILCAIFCASSGVYYAVFGAFFILLTGLYAWFEKNKPRKFFKACGLVIILCLTVMVNMSPTLIYHHQQGKNREISRSPADAETYGLKINQMITPIQQHHLRGFRKAAAHYEKISPLVNENRTATLGILGTIGFFALLLILLLRRNQVENALLMLLSRLTVFGILFGTIGGLGAVFSYRITPMIRSYNRISIFIGFFALLALFLIVQRFFQTRHKKLFWLVVLLLTMLGLFDETPISAPFTADYQRIQQKYAEDAQFAATLESRLPADSQIFQLPYIAFPENPPVVLMKDYEGFRLYLHTHQLHWSYGTIRGREIAAWQASVSAESPPEMLKTLKAAGFKGILIDQEGYLDRGATLEQTFSALLHEQPVLSPDHVFAFFSLEKNV